MAASCRPRLCARQLAGGLALIPSVLARDDPTTIAAFFTFGLTGFEESRVARRRQWCAEDAGATTETLRSPSRRPAGGGGASSCKDSLTSANSSTLTGYLDLTTPPTSQVPVFIVQGALMPWGPSTALSMFSAGLTHFSLSRCRTKDQAATARLRAPRRSASHFSAIRPRLDQGVRRRGPAAAIRGELTPSTRAGGLSDLRKPSPGRSATGPSRQVGDVDFGV
jgi:hypothetical protein